MCNSKHRIGFFLDQKDLNRKELEALEPPKGEYPKLAAENKQYLFLRTVLRENTALSFEIISEGAR